MLAKQQRLNLRLIDFPQFFKTTKKFSTQFFNGFYRWSKLTNDELVRSAVVVPKTVSLKAVERNKIKRLAYAAIEDNLKIISLDKNQQLQMAIFVKPAVIKAQPADFKETVKIFLKSIKKYAN